MVPGDGCPHRPGSARRAETSERSGPRRGSPPPRPRPRRRIKSGPGGGGGGGGDALRVPVLGRRSVPSAHSSLPARTMRRRQLPLVLLALVLCQAPRGPAAPLPAGTGTALDKMYPRGNHWAVGHLMGKKSTRESPYVYEGGSLKQQLQYILWEEAARNLLSLMEGKGTGSYQPPQRELLAIRQSPWDSQDGSAFKVVGSKRKAGGLSAPDSQRDGRDPQLN
ncbi:gastrin-releasing peptide isoform X2 [Leopardus geoffroyi]|uniref:gastrin-releasing peptide isoform X2 n=2 Tax=Felinae TaxID=338152 RepID=UPI001E25D98E|nr:gastrin-releasing peptide isoform X2 [Leopardus geoffroyi]